MLGARSATWLCSQRLVLKQGSWVYCPAAKNMDVHTSKERFLDLIVGDLVPRAPSTWGCGWGLWSSCWGKGDRGVSYWKELREWPGWRPSCELWELVVLEKPSSGVWWVLGSFLDNAGRNEMGRSCT